MQRIAVMHKQHVPVLSAAAARAHKWRHLCSQIDTTTLSIMVGSEKWLGRMNMNLAMCYIVCKKWNVFVGIQCISVLTTQKESFGTI